MFDIVLHCPEIPPNTGNIMRLCVNAPARLHLIEPLGFRMDERSLRRAGMDYRERAIVQCHPSLRRCRESLGSVRWVLFSSRAERPYSDWSFEAGDVMLFGSETAGLPAEVIDSLPADQRLLIPQMPGSRSLNLANAVAIGLFEAWRQLGFVGAVSSTRA